MSDDLDEIIKQVMQECVSSGRKPSGYWKEIENVKKELEPIIEELGRFPKQIEINESNSGLMAGIAKYHGGLNAIRELYGGEIVRKPKGFWPDIDNVKRTLDVIIEKEGGFPTTEKIKQRNPSLMDAISKYHGGINAIRELYGEKPLIRDMDYWKDIANIKLELEPIIEELERFPTCEEIQERNSGLLAGIYKYHENINNLRKIFGEDEIRRATGYWKVLSNLKGELDPIIENLGYFPSQKEISERNPSLVYAISKYHGGINAIRKLYGEKHVKRPNGYWNELGHVKPELESIIEELGRFPLPSEVKKNNLALYYGINRHHGGLNAIKIKLGYADQELGILQELMEGLKDE